MKIIKDSIKINVPSEKIFKWFLNLPENYKNWHPDHVMAYWTCPVNEMEQGASLYIEEYLHGKLHKIKFRATKVEKNQLIDYKFSFPFSLLSPGGSFSIEPDIGGAIFTASMKFRMGKLLSKLAKKQLEGFIKHMREEGENLKVILES